MIHREQRLSPACLALSPSLSCTFAPVPFHRSPDSSLRSPSQLKPTVDLHYIYYYSIKTVQLDANKHQSSAEVPEILAQRCFSFLGVLEASHLTPTDVIYLSLLEHLSLLLLENHLTKTGQN